MRKVVLICSVAVAGAVLAGCSSSGSPYATTREVAARVQASDGAAMPGLDVTVWIVNVDLAEGARQPEPLETRTTDAFGRVSWQVDADGQPYVCGYEVQDASGKELLSAAPDASNRLSAGDGLAVITL